MGASIYLGKVLSAGTKGCNIIVPTTTPFTGLLDIYPSAAVAYSLRKLRTDYSGNAIRVRRNIDNAEQNIGFSGNDLDTNSMLDFVGANLWTYSEEWDLGFSVKTGLNTTGIPSYIDVETAPDSTLTADKIIESAISQGHLTSRSFLVNTGVTYNVSVYLKSGGRDARVFSTISTLTTYQVDVDLTNGTLSGNTFPTSPVLENVGNGWFRLSYSVAATNTQTRTAITINLLNGTSINYLGNGTSGVFIWGAQISETSTVRNYQKTVATVGGNGFITTWYDQSTNANNSTQATAATQAQIVLNGNLILSTFTNKITTTWTDDRYDLTTGISPGTIYLSLNVLNRTATTNDFYSLGNAIFGGALNGQSPFYWAATTGNIQSFMQTSVTHGTDNTTGGFIVTSEKNASDLKTIYVDGVALPTTATEAPTAGSNLIYFGRAGNNYISGQLSEYIYWNSEQSANRIGIETNANTYWNAY